MAVLCLIYDLHQPGQAWAKIDNAMTALNLNGGRAFNTTWFVATPMTPEQLLSKVSPYFDDGDKAIVFQATRPGQWRGLSDEWTKWLQANL